MSYTDKTNEELINELLELQQSYNALRDQYEKEISLLRLAEEKVNKSDENFRKVFLTSPHSVNINRYSDGMYVSINEGFTNILGYTEEETIGKTSLELNIWADPENRKTLARELQEKNKVENFEAIFRKKDGDTVIGLMSASLIDLDGVPHILSVTEDITLRKHIEEKLLYEQFLIDALMNNLPDHVYFKDRESRFIRNNKAHALSFGLDNPDQLKGKTDFDFFSEQAAQKAYEDEQEILRTGDTVQKEEKLTRKNSSDVWFYAIKMPLRDSAGNIIGTFGISRDITEKKKSEEQLFLLANTLKSISECVSITDINDKVLFLNESFLKTYGYEKGELEGKLISVIGSPDNPPEIVSEILPATIEGGWHGELLNRKKDGSEFPISLSTSAIKNDLNEPVALIGVANDITKRRRSELQSQIIYEITQGVATTSNLDELLKLIHLSLGKGIYAENCFVALYDEKTGLFNFPYFVDKVDSAPMPTSMEKSCTAYVFRNKKPFLFNQEIFDRLVEKNDVELVGSFSPSWIGIPLQTPSKVIGVLVLQHYEKENVYSENDVKFLVSIGSQIAVSIERKKAEEEIKSKNLQLQKTNSEKDRFFSILAHDLRGPLSSFVGATQIITEEIQTMNIEEIKDITLRMKTSASNIYNLLENLLEWSRLKRDGLDFIPVKLNVKEKIEACIDVLSESARKKRIETTISIPDELEVVADNHMFDTVIRNLVSNALKFTHVGGKVSVTAEYKSDHSILVKISDSGIGMTPELKNKLFLLDEKTSRHGTEGEPSTGLGLLLCKEFIDKHGGKIWVESQDGKGSVFSFIIQESRKKERIG